MSTPTTSPLDGLRALLDERRGRRENDARRFAELDDDECQMCLAHGEDKRTLRITCFYAIDEVVPEAIDMAGVDGEARWDGYLLRICKSCRARFLHALEEWRWECIAMRDVAKDHDGHPEERDPERNIPVREHGRTVWLTREEWDERVAVAYEAEPPHGT